MSSISSDATEETSESESESESESLSDDEEDEEEVEGDRLRFLTGSSSSSIARKLESSLAAPSSSDPAFR